MGLPLLREAFEAARAAPIPSAMQNTAPMLDHLGQVVLQAQHKADRWREQTAMLVGGIRSATQNHLAAGGDVGEVVEDLEHLLAEVEARLRKTVDLSNRSMALAQRADRSEYELLFGDADMFLQHAERMQHLMDQDIETSQEFADFIATTIADIDPDARGGPCFDNADDLIAHLKG